MQVQAEMFIYAEKHFKYRVIYYLFFLSSSQQSFLSPQSHYQVLIVLSIIVQKRLKTQH